MCTLQKAQFKGNLYETVSVCLSQLKLGQDQIWVMAGQELGDKVQLKIKCELSRRHSFDPVFMKLCQNVSNYLIWARFETGSCWVEN